MLSERFDKWNIHCNSRVAVGSNPSISVKAFSLLIIYYWSVFYWLIILPIYTVYIIKSRLIENAKVDCLQGGTEIVWQNSVFCSYKWLVFIFFMWLNELLLNKKWATKYYVHVPVVGGKGESFGTLAWLYIIKSFWASVGDLRLDWS